MQKLKKSRRQLFEEVERAALQPLPARRYEFAQWAQAAGARRLPRRVRRALLQRARTNWSASRWTLRATASVVEVFLGGRRITSTCAATRSGRHTTQPEHMPQGHQAQAEWTPRGWSRGPKKTGPATAALVEEIMRRRVHPQQGFRACLGVLRLSRSATRRQRIEAACARALRLRACSYKSVAAILKNNLDRGAGRRADAGGAAAARATCAAPDYYH